MSDAANATVGLLFTSIPLPNSPIRLVTIPL